MATSCKCRDIGTIASANKCRCRMWEVSYIDSIVLDALRASQNVESDRGEKIWPSLVSFLAFRFCLRSFRLWASIRETLSAHQSKGIVAHLGNHLLLVPASCFRYHWVDQYSPPYPLLHESHPKEDLQWQLHLQWYHQGTPQ